MTSKKIYLVAISTWFAAFGMQSVVFAWLVTMLLREPAERVGYAQMSILLPGMLLILLAGAIADRVGLRRQALWSQLFAALTPMLLIYFLYFDALSYSVIIVYALLMGLAQAFVTPARDGLLNHVAGDNIQRMVVLASLCQFGFQIFGYALAGFADSVGAPLILGVQTLVLAFGVWAFTQVHLPSSPQSESASADDLVVRETIFGGLYAGARTVGSHPVMRMVVVQNVAMGCFFMGAFVVGFPLVMREVYDGTSGDLASLNAFNSLGLVLSLLLLLKIGYIQRVGRALLLSQVAGSVVLFLCGWVNDLVSFTILVMVWGLCGGFAMPMSRTLMQQLAPPHQHGRVMSFYSFSFMGSGPLGALFCGYMANLWGAQVAIICCAIAMLATTLTIGLFSPLWRSAIPSQPLQNASGEAA
ncbi:MAG TPA: hypothetical protein DER02_10565 [Gammaproteobacteria bacterium]|nr:hypothetical protein [Gammaproteobacteria bacterium]